MVFAKKKLISPRARLRRAGRIFAAIGEIIIVANFLYFVATWITIHPGVHITDVEITAGNAIDKTAVRTVADTALAERILWRIRKDNVVLYPENEMIKRILELDQRIVSADVATRGAHKLIITVSEHQPAKLWCREKEVEPATEDGATTTDQCFYANSAGFIFAESPQYLGTAFSVYRTKLPGTTTPVGTYMLPASEYANVESFVGALLSKGVTVRGVRQGEGGDYTFETNYPWNIEWSINEDPKTSADNLALVLESIAKDKDHPEPPKIIDLRFGNKVFYK